MLPGQRLVREPWRPWSKTGCVIERCSLANNATSGRSSSNPLISRTALRHVEGTSCGWRLLPPLLTTLRPKLAAAWTSSQAARRMPSSSSMASPLLIANWCIIAMTSHFSCLTLSSIWATKAFSSRSSLRTTSASTEVASACVCWAPMARGVLLSLFCCRFFSSATRSRSWPSRRAAWAAPWSSPSPAWRRSWTAMVSCRHCCCSRSR
mmetsp:Transcript_45507/g.131815  ORF Transcript_45507/g.131815 Transcript_45507/m.131815 type:complete len:208 (+) Transcript_45507:463-1086(+)